MSLDPFTLIAQMVNFAILVWILNKVLYGPILQAIAARESGFAKRREELQAEEQHCQGLREELESEKQQLQQQVQEILDQARAEASQSREAEVVRTRTEVNQLEERWKESLAHQKEAFIGQLRRRAASSALQVARGVLRDVAGSFVDLQSRAVERFLSDISGQEFAGQTIVRSATDLEPEHKDRLETFLEEVTYEVDPELILGLEIVNEGERFGWSAEAYLRASEADLEATFTEVLGDA